MHSVVRFLCDLRVVLSAWAKQLALVSSLTWTFQHAVSSDASASAVGCFSRLAGSQKLLLGQELLEAGEGEASSTFRELVGAERALIMMEKDVGHEDVVLIIDNQGAAGILMIGSRVAELQRVAARIFMWAVRRGCRIFPRWRRRDTDEVVLCDWLSKLIDVTAWGVDPALFAALDADPRFGGAEGHQVDLFAGEGNSLLPRFFARFQCRRAEAADAFTQEWRGLNGFANPPRTLIPRVIAHARACECTCTLLVPLEPAAMWWPLVAAPARAPAHLPPGVSAVRDFASYKGIATANGALPRTPTRCGLRAVRLDFRQWAWRNGGRRSAAALDALLSEGNRAAEASSSLTSSAGAASGYVAAALRQAASW